MRDWTAEEKKSITNLLKRIPVADRPTVRNAVKDMQADEAITYIKGLKASEKPFKPLKASEGTSTPEKTQGKPTSRDQGKTIAQDQDKLERVQGEIYSDTIDIDDIKNSIDSLIRAWCEYNDIDDLRKAEQPIFNALCSDIGNTIFKPSAILKDHNQYINGSAVPTNNNQYDIDKVISIIDLCTYYCNIYNKVFTIHAAAAFCGVSKDFFYDNREKLTRLGCDLWKNSELSLADSIVSGKRNPTGALAALNHWHGWSGASTNRTEVRETTVVYPVLVDINRSGRETISDKQS